VMSKGAYGDALKIKLSSGHFLLQRGLRTGDRFFIFFRTRPARSNRSAPGAYLLAGHCYWLQDGVADSDDFVFDDAT